MKLRELFALELTISRDCLNSHSTNLEEQLAKAYRKRLNENEDVLLFTDFNVSRKVLQMLFKRRHYQEAGRRRARRLKNAGTHSSEDICKLWEIQQGKCYYTGKSLGKTFKTALYAKDHIIPVAKKGVNTAYNIALCLRSINEEKGDDSKKNFIKRKRIPKKQRDQMFLIDLMREKEFWKISPMKPKVANGDSQVYRYLTEMKTGPKFTLVSSLPIDLQKYKTDRLRKPLF